MRYPGVACVVLGLALTACSRPAPPPSPESSADNAAASAPAGTGAQRQKLPDQVNDGRPASGAANAEPRG